MTSDEILYTTLREVGIPGTKSAWPIAKGTENNVPPLPWFVYKRRRGGEVYADDGNFARLKRYEVALYQSDLDDDLTDAFEEALGRVGPFSSYDEVWIPSESCWVTTYDLTFHPATE